MAAHCCCSLARRYPFVKRLAERYKAMHIGRPNVPGSRSLRYVLKFSTYQNEHRTSFIDTLARPGSIRSRQGPPYFTALNSFAEMLLAFSDEESLYQAFTRLTIYSIHLSRHTSIIIIYANHLKSNHKESQDILHVLRTLRFLCPFIVAWLTLRRLVAIAQYKTSAIFLEFNIFSNFQSGAFSFLRYSGPRRLRASRRVLVDDDKFQIMHIGRGAFATISRVLSKSSGDVRVMKRMVLDKAGFAKALAQAEVDSLNAVAGSVWFPVLLNHFMDEEEYIITMPFYRRGDMAGLIDSKGYLGTELAQFYCAQLILAIQCLHKQGIVHRDIKPENIFLDENGHLILADLGLAENIGTFDGDEAEVAKFRVWQEAKARDGEDYPLLWVDGVNPLGVREIAGTYWFTAPEVFRNERYSFGVDYYSVGVVYCELVTGNIPFNNFEPYPENKRPEVDFRWKPGQIKGLESWEKQAILKILAPNPRDRPQTVTKLKESPLFAGVDWNRMVRRDVLPPPLPLPLREG